LGVVGFIFTVIGPGIECVGKSGIDPLPPLS
jgi:hypothetical protein